MANAIHIGASIASLTDLGGASYGLVLLRGERVGLSGAQIDLGELPGFDGGYAMVNGSRLRQMVLPCLVSGSSHSDALSKVESVVALLNPALGSQYLKLDSESDRAWLGKVGGEISKKPRGIAAFELSIPWVCEHAHAYSTSETVQSETVSSDPEAANVPASGVVAGSAYAYPVWVVKNTSGSDSDPLSLNNATTAETVSTSAGLANGAWARFDAARQIIEKSTDSGSSWSAWMTARGAYRAIPRLKPGVANSISLGGLSAGSLVCTYRARYL